MSSRPYRRLLPVDSLVPPVLLLALVAGCREGGVGRDAPALTGPSLAAQAASIEASFPGRSAAVLRAGVGFTKGATGFVAAGIDAAAPAPRARTAARRRGARLGARGPSRTLALEVPAEASAPLRFHAGGAPVSVREVGAAGEVRALEQAVGYARAGGASFWTALPCRAGRDAEAARAAGVSAAACGAEEWLRFAPGAVVDGVPAAAWEITGATLAQRGDAIEVTSADGATRLWVTAPAAFAEGGAPVEARLRPSGSTIELFVEAGGRGVLVDPMWVSVAPMPGGLEYQVAATTGDGRVLVAGGDDDANTLDAAYLYDPAKNTWTTEPAMTNPRESHTATTLGNGQVLIAGGVNQGQPLGDADLFDPVAGTWSNSTMPNQHSAHTATLLKDGSVLVAGGQGSGSCGGTILLDAVDLFDPALGLGGTWMPTAPLNDPRYFHAAVRLPNGDVLVSGGYGNDTVLSDSEIYDPVLQTWTFTEGSMNIGRADLTMALLPDGTVLAVGGDGDQPAYASAEIYNPTTQLWSLTGSMATARSYHQMITIPGGQVMVVGGDDGSQSLGTTEIYDPATKKWSPGPTLIEIRETFALASYGNTVLAVGGWDSSMQDVTPTAEVLVFGLPDGTACQMGSACASGFCTAGLCCDTACAGTCMACTAALKGTGADGTCGPVEAGTNPGQQCKDQGPATCGTNGFCDGNGACGSYVDGTICNTKTECVVAVCTGGVCGGPHELDGTPCTGGLCIAGTCVKDPHVGGSTSAGGGGATTTSSSAGSGAGAGTGTDGSGSTGGGQGGEATAGDLSGGGCGVGSGAPPAGAAAGLAVALLAALRRRVRSAIALGRAGGMGGSPS